MDGNEPPEDLERKAESIKAQYNRVRDDLKARPSDPSLRAKAAQLKRQYEVLAAEFQKTAQHEAKQTTASNHGQADSSTAQPDFDPGAILDAPADRPKPVVVNTGPSFLERIGSMLSGMNIIRFAIMFPLLLALFGIIALIGSGSLSFYEVPTESMLPTLQPGDRIIARIARDYERGDIVVVPDPEAPRDFLVKRLVALPGDTVEIYNGMLHLNGEAIVEPYIREGMEFTFGSYTLPAGEAFLLGDNRNESDDSTELGRGFLLDQIKGRVIYIYAPSDRRGALKDGRSAFTGP